MIRLTVLYNLPDGTDEREFLDWRLTEHAASNASIPGVVSTDFAIVDGSWPPGEAPRFRFMTTVEWEDRESFERGFYDADVQSDLKSNLKRMADPMFLISETVTTRE